MRDYILTLIVFAGLPLILRKPFFGILMWTWLGLMSPHRLCWGFAVNFPFAEVVALTFILSFLIGKDVKRLPAVPLTWLLGFWWLWLFITTLTALYPAAAWGEWGRSWKIMLLTFMSISLLTTRDRIDALVWTIVISLGFYGVKGGIFTITSGGVNHVLGPAKSFISGNNEIGLALVMTVPLMRYLHLASGYKQIKLGMIAAMGLTLVAILGTQSRGALVGLLAMVLYLTVKSRNKTGLLVVLMMALPAAFLIMPEAWYARMQTIETYQQDSSALGRINAWWTAWNVALDHPIVGGGFRTFQRATFVQYAPDPGNFHDVHSIYFEALAEHGFVGLITFLGIGIGALLSLNRVIRFARPHPDLAWMRDLASMIYVSIIGYAVSGIFLGLSMFDYYYTLLAITIGLSGMVRRYARDGIPALEPRPVSSADVATDWRLGKGRRLPAQRQGLRLFRQAADWFARL